MQFKGLGLCLGRIEQVLNPAVVTGMWAGTVTEYPAEKYAAMCAEHGIGRPRPAVSLSMGYSDTEKKP